MATVTKKIVFKEVVTVVNEDTITFTLSKEEAEHLQAIFYNIGEGWDSTTQKYVGVRGTTDSLSKQLSELGISPTRNALKGYLSSI